MKLQKLFTTFLVVALVMTNSFVAFAEGDLRPVGISLMTHQIPPGSEMEFQIFETFNQRQNVNQGEPEQWPSDYLLELEYTDNMLGGVWSVNKVYSKNNFEELPNNTYSFVVPNTLGYYRVTVKDAVGTEFASEYFEVAEKPYLVVDRVVEPGDNITLEIYDENGQPWNIDDWGTGETEYQLDIYRNGGVAFLTHATLGFDDEDENEYQIIDNQDGTYTFPAGDEEDSFYIRLEKGTGLSLVWLDSTSYDVHIASDEAEDAEDDEEEEENEDDDENDDDYEDGIPEIYHPEEDDSDVCDPGEYCPEDEDEEDEDGDDNSGRRFSFNTAARAELPDFHFVNWAPKIILDQDFSYDDYDFELDSYELVEDPYTCEDLGEHWGKNLIQNLLSSGKYPVEVSDDEKHLCRPDKEVSREKLMAWLLFVFYPDLADQAYALELEAAENPYEDLDEEFGPYVLMATNAGIVHGQDGCAKNKEVNCKFGNGSTVNRAEILKMAIEASGIEFSVEELKAQYPEKDPIKMFTDIKNDKDWFYGYLYFATAHDVIQGVQVGDNKYEAMMGAGLSFSQAAKIINLISELN